MKKIMIAAAVAVSAACLNAATVNWLAAKGYLFDGESGNKVTSGTAYLMYVTSTYTQTDLVDAFASANGDVSATLASINGSGALVGTGTISDKARISGKSDSDLAKAGATAYFVVFNADKMYVSITGDAIYDSLSGESSLTFATITDSSKLDFQAADGYSKAGWYAVPEPTSGLLLLIGMAGLALKRKRA